MNSVRSDRLTLEPQVAAHADEMYPVLCDPALYEHENEPPPSLEWLRERFRRLESRSSPDGRERWLNWVVRLPSSELVGFVQATVTPDATASVAYVLHSGYWGQGLAGEAVRAMLRELVEHHGVAEFSAVLKRTNRRSLRLLERLGFSLASEQRHAQACVEPDELLLLRDAEPRPARR